MALREARIRVDPAALALPSLSGAVRYSRPLIAGPAGIFR
jgi:hypothetical protein